MKLAAAKARATHDASRSVAILRHQNHHLPHDSGHVAVPLSASTPHVIWLSVPPAGLGAPSRLEFEPLDDIASPTSLRKDWREEERERCGVRLDRLIAAK